MIEAHRKRNLVLTWLLKAQVLSALTDSLYQNWLGLQQPMGQDSLDPSGGSKLRGNTLWVCDPCGQRSCRLHS